MESQSADKMESPSSQSITMRGQRRNQWSYRYDDRQRPDERLSLRKGADSDCETTLSRISNKRFMRGRDDQDDAMTAVTGATSEFAYSVCESENEPSGLRLFCARYSGPVFAAIIGAAAFVSPIIMVVLPVVGIGVWDIREPCEVNCESILIGLAFRLLLLLAASFVLFFRRPRSTMPRIFVFRAVIIFFIFVLSFTYWLFYIVRVYSYFGRLADDNNDGENLDLESYQHLTTFNIPGVKYEEIAVFASSFADVLIFVHYLAVIMIELRHLEKLYVVKILRSPDGIARSYTVGRLSIQRLAVWCLERYYRDFKVYNPYLEVVSGSSSQVTSIKVYDVDQPSGTSAADDDIPQPGMTRHRGSHRDERFYLEDEYEKRVLRRRARLQTAAEEAFTLVRRMKDTESSPTSVMDSVESAQAIFPTLERPLRKYLRVTRQQPWHSRDSVLQHLSNCISHDLSACTFLEKYFARGMAVIWSDRECMSSQMWAITCEHVVSRVAEDGTYFQLRHGDVVLSIIVRQLPDLIIRPSPRQTNDAFALNVNSETHV